MKIVISPAKTLDLESKLPTTRATQPAFLDTTFKVNNKLAKTSRKKLMELMDISPNLAELNHQRYQEFQEEHTKTNSRPAVYTFAGDVYVGLDAYTISTDKLDQLQDTLRILSGFYGILKPLDLIQPYRLEMGIPLSVGRKANLYELWREKVTSYLNEELKEDEILLNLASNEYFKAVDAKNIKAPIITPVFKDYKNGKLKVISFFAKKARGSMVRYIIQNNVKTVEELKDFNVDGYAFSQEESVKENELLFTR